MGCGVIVLNIPVIEVVSETGSTNSDLLTRLAQGEVISEGHWLRAERQSSGRGRMGRQWNSPVGNLYCSTVVRVKEGDPPAHSLSFVAGLAVHDLLVGQLMVASDHRWLKWPNDIIWHGAKMAGILLERQGDTVVVGIGVNVAFAPEIAGRETTCIHIANPKNENDAAAILGYLAPAFAERVKEWRTLGLAYVLDQWMERAHRKGTRLTVSDGIQAGVTGGFDGLQSDGALRLKQDDASVVIVNAGEIRMTSGQA